jgi:predicted nucleic acid-binding Zn ribbon protein
MKWNKEDVEKAIILNKEGKKFQEIAEALNRNFRCVQIKLNKLGYHQNYIETKETKACLNCGKIFSSLIKKKRKFCSQSCGAEYNNKKYPKRANINKLKNCLYCGKSLNSHQIKFCSPKCMKCGWHEVNPTTGLIPIQLEHKDGNSENHNLNNLELLCPNCHSLTPTYGALNKGNGRSKRREKRKSLAY